MIGLVDDHREYGLSNFLGVSESAAIAMLTIACVCSDHFSDLAWRAQLHRGMHTSRACGHISIKRYLILHFKNSIMNFYK